MEHTNDHSTAQGQSHGLFYTYFGETGAATAAFIYFLILLTCIFSFINWG